MLKALVKAMDPYYWYAAFLMARSQITKQYRNSYLGAVWVLLQPMAIMGMFIFIMPMLLKSRPDHYAIYVLATVPLWNFIAASLITTSNSLLENVGTLTRCRVTSSLFPVANVLRQAYIYLVSFGAMILLAYVVGLQVSVYFLLWPLFFIPVMIGVMAMSIGLSYCAPYVRDISECITVGMTVSMWGSAVIYPIESLPERAQAIIAWNPLYMLIKPAITIMYEQQIPDVMACAKQLAVMCAGIIVGYILYRMGRRDYVYYL